MRQWRDEESALRFQAVVLEARGFLDGRRATAHPAFVAQLSDQGYDCHTTGGGCLSGVYRSSGNSGMQQLGPHDLLQYTVHAPLCSEAEARVVVDGPFITSRGPGTALEFSLALVKVRPSDTRRPCICSEVIALGASIAWQYWAQNCLPWPEQLKQWIVSRRPGALRRHCSAETRPLMLQDPWFLQMA